jgi:hypothetical protein
MISISCAVYSSRFEWQLNLFWHNHKKLYKEDAYNKAHAIITNRNDPTDADITNVDWDIDVPYTLCKSFFDYDSSLDCNNGFFKPLNIQLGLQQIIEKFDDEEILEILDGDMFHMKPAPDIEVGDFEILVCDLYEKWHLKSLTDLNYVIDSAIEIKNPIFYNGGFVPIIGKVKTFKLLLNNWIQDHIRIVNENPHRTDIKWWAGMYSLQTACQNNKITMKSFNKCYIPNFNQIETEHYVTHYSVDPIFAKSKFPNVNLDNAPDNLFYNLIKEWLLR